jgi:bromodomain-containing factor 1
MDIHTKAQQVCMTVTKNLIANKNGGPFAVPVDYVSLGIPHYPDIIKNPMDLGSIQKKTGELGVLECG